MEFARLPGSGAMGAPRMALVHLAGDILINFRIVHDYADLELRKQCVPLSSRTGISAAYRILT